MRPLLQCLCIVGITEIKRETFWSHIIWHFKVLWRSFHVLSSHCCNNWVYNHNKSKNREREFLGFAQKTIGLGKNQFFIWRRQKLPGNKTDKSVRLCYF